MSLADAVAAAEAETGLAEPVEIPEVSPTEGEDELFAEDQAEAETEQAEVTDSQEEVFDEIEVEEPETDLDSLTFELPTVDAPVTLDELKQGYLRHADYTRKTQELAREREAAVQAVRLLDALRADPRGTVLSLADAAGFAIGEPTKPLEFSPFQTAGAVEEEIARRVEEAVAKHPDVQEAKLAKAEKTISDEFSRIEQARGVVLGPKSRQKVLDRAAQLGTVNLELVVDSMLLERGRKQETVDSLRQAASAKPKAGARAEDRHDDLPKVVNTLQDAVELTLAEMEGRI